MSKPQLSEHYRIARDAIEKLYTDPALIPYQRLEELKLLRDLADDRVWDIKQATGIGLWRRLEGE